MVASVVTVPPVNIAPLPVRQFVKRLTSPLSVMRILNSTSSKPAFGVTVAKYLT